MADLKENSEIICAAAYVLSCAALNIIYRDPHQWSTRPCVSCQTVSNIIPEPFGCLKYKKERAS